MSRARGRGGKGHWNARCGVCGRYTRAHAEVDCIEEFIAGHEVERDIHERERSALG